MKLSFDQLKSIIQGAAYLSEEENGLQPHRFNKEEEAYYCATTHAKKAFSSASVQAVFKTDADKLILKANVSTGSTRSYFSFDVYVNDVFTAEFKNFDHEKMTLPYTGAKCPLGDFSWELSMEKGEKTIRIVFPFSSKVIISEFTLENATFVEPVRRSKTMLMYGDSITHGYDALNPSRAYAPQLAHALDAYVINKAIGGEIFQPELSAIKNDISPDYITVAYGTNDWSKCTEEVFLANCKGFYQNLKNNYPDARIFAITPIWREDMDKETACGLFDDARKAIHSICEEIGGITVIDGFNFVPQETELYADLRLHPTNEGFDFYAKNLICEIKKHI